MKTLSLKRNFGEIKKASARDFIKKNKMLVFLAMFLLCGICFGAVLIKLADENAIKFMNVLFLSDFKERLNKPLLEAFITSISSTFVFGLISFFMGLSMWGFILAPIVPFVRGVCIGLCEGYLYSAYGLKGVCFHALIFLPGIFISSIAILLMTREAMKISNCFSSAMLTNSNASATSTSIKLYVIRSSCITIIILISSVIDLISSLMFSKFFSF